MKFITRPDRSPLLTFRFVFHRGASTEPAPGVAGLTARMLGEAGTRLLTYKQILDSFFEMGVSVDVSVDKEMTAFVAETHLDNLEAFYGIFRQMLLDPGWRDEDLSRLRDDAINRLEVELRGQNDEELAKEVLYQEIYGGHPYGIETTGTVSSLSQLSMEDLRAYYRSAYCSDVLTIGLAGGYPEDLPARIAQDFSLLPESASVSPPVPEPWNSDGNRAVIVEKPARSVAISFGFPLQLRRGDPDFVALLLATSALGQHRMSSGRLFTRMRQLRGLNYGDYAYLEYFPGGMYSLEPRPNLGRLSQIFQIWIRPVERNQATFALRLALYELDRLIRDGLSAEEFARTRSFLSKYVNVLLSTKSAELGYAIDSEYYGIPEYPQYVRAELAKLTLERVNQAIQAHLRSSRLAIVMVAQDAAGLRDELMSGWPSPMTYNSPKPEEILAEDRTVENYPVPIADLRVMPVVEVFA